MYFYSFHEVRILLIRYCCEEITSSSNETQRMQLG